MKTHFREHLGFTVVELLVSLAVASVLIGIAVPAFTGFLAQRTMAARANDFVLAVTYARSEAVRRGGQPVTVDVVAVGNDSDNEWGGGYCVVLSGSDCGDTDDVLRAFPAIPASDNVTLNGTGGFHGKYRLSFNSRGILTLGAAGSVELCSSERDPGRVVDVSFTGRPDVEELTCNP